MLKCAKADGWQSIVCENKNAYASRRVNSPGGGKDSVNSVAPVYFMDVGCWQGGHYGDPVTTYGLVSGRDAVLCSWLGRENPGLHTSPMSKPNDVIDNLLAKAKAKGRSGAVAWARSRRDFVPPDDLLFVLPDLHLHAYVNQSVDRFQYRKSTKKIKKQVGYTIKDGLPKHKKVYAHRLESLQHELAELLGIAKECGARVIQIGDLYEVWEVEILLRKQYLELLEYAHDEWEEVQRHHHVSRRAAAGSMHPGHNPMSTQGMVLKPFTRQNFEEIYPKNVIKWMITTGKVILRDFGGEDHRPDNKDEWLRAMAKIPWGNFQDRGVDFQSTDEIKKAIERAHPPLFDKKLIDDEILGNHDNFLENRYWSDNSADDFKSNALDIYGFLRQPTKAGTMGQRKPSLRIHNTWIEHGNYYDWHNADAEFAKPDRGFAVVTELNFANWAPHRKQGPNPWWRETSLKVASRFTDWGNYEMRLPEVRRADAVFGHPYKEKYRVADTDPISGSEDRPNLVIMGHTHGPALIEWPGGAPQPLRTYKGKEWDSFVKGKYFLHEDWAPGGKEQMRKDVDAELKRIADEGVD